MSILRDKKYWLGIILGVVLLGSYLGFDAYKHYQQASIVKNSVEISTEKTLTEPLASNLPSSSADPFIEPSPKLSPTPKPTAKPTPKPSIIPSPTPAPKSLPDYYYLDKIVMHANGYPTDATTFAQSQSLMGMYAEVGFRNNTNIYGDGDLKLTIYVNGNIASQQSINKYIDSAYYFKYYPSVQAGTYTVKFVINENAVVAESNYGNNDVSLTFTIAGDTTAPTYSIEGPFIIDGKSCMRWVNLSDNYSVYTDVWAKWKIDNGEWSNRTSENPYGCSTGTAGSSHTYYVHAEDKAGNVNEQSRDFTIY